MKKAFVVIALITVLALSGCVLPTPGSNEIEQPSFSSSQGAQQQDNQPQSDRQQDNQVPNPGLVQCPDGSFAASSDLCIGSEEQPSANTGVESCGSINITNVVASTYLPGEEENLSCFNQNMASCINSTLELTGQFGGLFSVLGGDGNNCILSYYDYTDYVQKTCNFPKSFLETSVQSAEQASQSNLPLLAISGVLGGKQLKDSETGAIIEIECS